MKQGQRSWTLSYIRENGSESIAGYVDAGGCVRRGWMYVQEVVWEVGVG
jgi:hypothetical protein